MSIIQKYIVYTQKYIIYTQKYIIYTQKYIVYTQKYITCTVYTNVHVHSKVHYLHTKVHYIHTKVHYVVFIHKGTLYTCTHKSTVRPVLRGHLWGKEKVTFKDRWPLKRGSIQMKFSIVGQRKCDLLIYM